MTSSQEIFTALTKSSLGVSSKIFFNAIVIKIIAVFMGPSGVGLFSQIRQIWQTFTTIGSMNSGAAIIQGISSRVESEKRVFTSSTFWIILSLNLLNSSLILIFDNEISYYFLKSTDNESIQAIRLLSLSTFISVFLIFFSSILNGYRAIGKYSIVIAVGSFTLMILAWPIAIQSSSFGLEFVLILIVSEFLALVICIILLFKNNLFLFNLPPKARFINNVKDFFKTSSILLITGIYTMLVLLFIRIFILDKYGFYSLGIFDAAWLLCMVYVLLITKSFGTYFLPKFSGIEDPIIRNNLINDGLRIVILVSVPIIVIMINIKPFIIRLLYTIEFNESLELMQWMLIGDFFKITSWFLAFTILAYKDMRIFLWSELIFNSALLFGILSAISFFDTLEVVGIIFLLITIPYFIFTIRYNQIKHGLKFNKSLLLAIVFAILIITISSIATWNILLIDYRISIINIIISIAFSWFVLNIEEKKSILNFIYRF
jgi:O-antigen/teichoic acid export membrane protein